MTEAAYDRMGIGYSAVRRPDPRIAARIQAALGEATSVLNVGAGTGSYEPADRDVTALEPSREMIAQRPAGSAPVIQGVAEDLPFEDDSYDAAMALITVHHWDDLAGRPGRDGAGCKAAGGRPHLHTDAARQALAEARLLPRRCSTSTPA